MCTTESSVWFGRCPVHSESHSSLIILKHLVPLHLPSQFSNISKVFFLICSFIRTQSQGAHFGNKIHKAAGLVAFFRRSDFKWEKNLLTQYLECIQLFFNTLRHVREDLFYLFFILSMKGIYQTQIQPLDTICFYTTQCSIV